MSPVVAVILLLFAAVLAWFIYSLVWGKPWVINHLYMRLFIQLAFDSPELLTMLGLLEKFGWHRHNAQLADISEAHEIKTFARLRRGLSLLRSYDRRRQNGIQLLSTDILDYFLDDMLRGEPYRHHGYLLNQMFGLQSELPNLMTTLHPVTSPVDARNYVKRLAKFGVKFDQALERLKISEQKGILPPRFVIQRVLDEMTAFIGQPAETNPLYTVFQEKLGKLKLNDTARADLLNKAKNEIIHTVYPAYQKLINYFGPLEEKATDDDGVWKLPDGEAYYAYCLRNNTTTDLSPEEVHQTGLQEVARIEQEMQAILDGLGFPGEPYPPQKLREFASQERFLFPNTAEGRAAALAEYKAILDHVANSLDSVFDLRPKAGLKVERVPEFREKTSAGAYYQMPDMGGGRPGIFFANLRDMKEVAKFGMKTLSYHEGIPGHHFQLAIAQELRGVPFFRRLVPFTAYAEGWALYAEKLCREIGLYKDDPYSELGCLDSELFRAVRLVVDTGIHYKRWTRQQAIDYMCQHTGSELASIVSEVERYIVMPGQACAYKVGELKILALRAKARQALGSRFSLREFHNVVLKNGSTPLSILERIVEEYIAAHG